MQNLSSPFSRWRRVIALAAGASLGLGVSPAATLSFDAPLHIEPNENAPVVGTAPQGTTLTPVLRADLAAAGIAPPPPGWIAIRSEGPFTGFVHNANVQPDGTIKAGADIRAQPLADAPLQLVVEEGDRTEAVEPVGDWSRATIHTELIVFVHALPPASRGTATAAGPMPDDDGPMLETATAETKPVRPAKVRKPKREKTRKEPKVEPVPVETAGAPRVFEGYLMPVRRIFGKPKYTYELLDENNQRIALLDFSSLSGAAQLDAFENRRISVYGPGMTRADLEDLIIRVERLQLLK